MPEELWGYKIGDRVSVKLQMIPFMSGHFPDKEHEVVIQDIRASEGRLYLKSSDWPKLNGPTREILWIDNPTAIRHVVQIDESVIQSSKQDLASWIKEFS